METLIDYVRLAACAGSTDDERRRAIAACYLLADGFGEGIAGVDIRPAAANAAIPVPTEVQPDPAPSANPFSGLTADQILELVISRLRGVAGDVPPAPLGHPFRLTLVPIPRAS